MIQAFNPTTDLMIERTLPLPPAAVWAAWTQPELLMRFFTPHPWTTTDCTIDLRPGGSFKATMRSPDGEVIPNEFCYLEVIPNQKLVWTNTMAAGFRPVPDPTFVITSVLELSGEFETHYRTLALHRDAAGREHHEKMGFYDGWNAVIDQLVAAMLETR